MKREGRPKFAALVSAAVLLAGLFAAGIGRGSSATAPQTWEYKVESKCFDEKRLNALGSQGWELAGFSISDAGVGGWHCILKRQKN